MTTKNQAYDNVESKLVTASERRMVTAHGIINKHNDKNKNNSICFHNFHIKCGIDSLWC